MASAGNQITANNTFGQNGPFVLSVCASIKSKPVSAAVTADVLPALGVRQGRVLNANTSGVNRSTIDPSVIF